jgi:hypothetical protein
MSPPGCDWEYLRLDRGYSKRREKERKREKMTEHDVRCAAETLHQLTENPEQFGLDDDEIMVLLASEGTLVSLIKPHPDPPVEEIIDLTPDADGVWSVAE